MTFNILSLSGGGYLGLYSAAVLEKLEEHFGKSIGQVFDLIAGTSIGGIIGLGLAAGIPASDIVKIFSEDGHKIFGKNRPQQGALANIFGVVKSAGRAKYEADKLKATISRIIDPELKVGDLRTRVLIPTVNLTKGQAQIFKTPHHPTFVRDLHMRVVDIALATSAAPTFFKSHSIGGERFADGGLYANSPDLLALHEAQHFLGQPLEDIRVLSIGTTTSRFSMSNATTDNLGWLGWMKNQRLISATMASQQQVGTFMMNHRLSDRYSRIDREQSKEQERELALDIASDAATLDLVGLANASIQDQIGEQNIIDIFNRDPAQTVRGF